MFGGSGGFGRHVPSSDPPIPPKDACLACGKKQDDSSDAKLLRCSACKMAYFCSKECQAIAWKGNGKITPEKHKLVCKELATRNSGDKLPYQVRVIRNRSGATIENGDAIPQARLPETKAELETLEQQDLNECARDHYFSVVKDLTDEQLEERYPLACAERWGGKEHYDELDGEPGTVRLEALLTSSDYEDCAQCGGDGSQFFSFCLNRPVNSDRVQHCEFCHKCFYFRPGCLKGCQHCGKGYYYDSDGDPRALANAAGITVEEAAKKLAESDSDQIVIEYAEDGRGCNIPRNADSFTLGMASEGYWGW